MTTLVLVSMLLQSAPAKPSDVCGRYVSALPSAKPTPTDVAQVTQCAAALVATESATTISPSAVRNLRAWFDASGDGDRTTELAKLIKALEQSAPEPWPITARLVPEFVMTAANDKITASSFAQNVSTTLRIQSEDWAIGRTSHWNFGGFIGYVPTTTVAQVEKTTSATSQASSPQAIQSGTFSALIEPSVSVFSSKTKDISLAYGAGVSQLIDPTPVKATGDVDAVVLKPLSGSQLATHHQLTLAWNRFGIAQAVAEGLRLPAATVSFTVRKDNRLSTSDMLGGYFMPDWRKITRVVLRDIPILGARRDSTSEPLSFGLTLEYEAPLRIRAGEKSVAPSLRIMFSGELDILKLLSGTPSKRTSN